MPDVWPDWFDPEGLTLPALAEEFERPVDSVQTGRLAAVPVKPFRDYFLALGISQCELARRMGWMRPNIDKVRRTLGLRPDSNSRDGVRAEPRKLVTYRTAERLMVAMNADPIDVGL